MKNIHLLIALTTGTLMINAQNESKLVLDASSTQSNLNPLIRLRDHTGADMMWIHSDHQSNTFVGNRAGAHNTSPFNTAVGAFALNINTTGYSNTASGSNALSRNTTGIFNTASGAYSLFENSSGSSNTAHGIRALYRNKTGIYNTASGDNALHDNTDGSYNTAFGAAALYTSNTAQYNTALGHNAGALFVNGWNNVFLGANSDVNANGLYNVVAVGLGTVVTDNSTARFGNTATTSYGGWAGWSNVSDGRFKKNVRADVIGLDFIMRLQPVTYHLDVSGLSQALNENHGQEWDVQMKAAIVKKEKLVQSGFIAQEVEAAAIEVGYNFSGVDVPDKESDFYGLRYAEFVVPLVKAVQELNAELAAQNESLHAQNESLQSEVGSLQVEAGRTESTISKQQTVIDMLNLRLERLEALMGVKDSQYITADFYVSPVN